MITVLHRGGSSQMITVLHRGGPANDYGITWGWCVKKITVHHEYWVATLEISFPET